MSLVIEQNCKPYNFSQMDGFVHGFCVTDIFFGMNLQLNKCHEQTLPTVTLSDLFLFMQHAYQYSSLCFLCLSSAFLFLLRCKASMTRGGLFSPEDMLTDNCK